jgi:hypothetical protein
LDDEDPAVDDEDPAQHPEKGSDEEDHFYPVDRDTEIKPSASATRYTPGTSLNAPGSTPKDAQSANAPDRKASAIRTKRQHESVDTGCGPNNITEKLLVEKQLHDIDALVDDEDVIIARLEVLMTT